MHLYWSKKQWSIEWLPPKIFLEKPEELFFILSDKEVDCADLLIEYWRKNRRKQNKTKQPNSNKTVRVGKQLYHFLTPDDTSWNCNYLSFLILLKLCILSWVIFLIPFSETAGLPSNLLMETPGQVHYNGLSFLNCFSARYSFLFFLFNLVNTLIGWNKIKIHQIDYTWSPFCKCMLTRLN